MDSVVGLPLLFMILPNQFGAKRKVNSLACHALVFLMLGRLFLAGHYLEMGIYRKYFIAHFSFQLKSFGFTLSEASFVLRPCRRANFCGAVTNVKVVPDLVDV